MQIFILFFLAASSFTTGKNLTAGQNFTAEQNFTVEQNLTAAQNFTDGQNNSTNDCGQRIITCVCGTGDDLKYEKLELEVNITVHQESGEIECAIEKDPYEICGDMGCSLHSDMETRLFEESPVMAYYSYSENDNRALWPVYPKVFTIPHGGLPEGHRYVRQIDPCRLTPLENASIKCWKWPNWMNCDINCIYGYALEDGKKSVTKKNINCRYSEDQWKPHAPMECKPYLNCKVHLTRPGEMKCKEPLDTPPYCEISCLEYDEDPETKRQKYVCSDETYASSLPHCAAISKVPLLNKPS